MDYWSEYHAIFEQFDHFQLEWQISPTEVSCFELLPYYYSLFNMMALLWMMHFELSFFTLKFHLSLNLITYYCIKFQMKKNQIILLILLQNNVCSVEKQGRWRSSYRRVIIKKYYKFSLIEANKSTSGKNSKLRMAVIFIKQLKKLENEKALLIREIEEKNLCIQVL